ncbi:hypothetical protein PVAND_000953 [Polypedilum vanderplanki]|uniref:Uncharacterized protein n=1 Tax=Polypedilum vanderplanki TaxID=319348 RepID=A0A9J6BMN6_POLVA|nr:hypothetical protein PVAND_000953 [Polypedilum vanderplanki]
MRRKLDPDNTSIILLSDFMYEFFPEDKKSTPDTFDLFHYNGIPNSNALNKYSGSNPMLTVLQTKWPNIEINWIQDTIPSLN